MQFFLFCRHWEYELLLPKKAGALCDDFLNKRFVQFELDEITAFDLVKVVVNIKMEHPALDLRLKDCLVFNDKSKTFQFHDWSVLVLITELALWKYDKTGKAKEDTVLAWQAEKDEVDHRVPHFFGKLMRKIYPEEESSRCNGSLKLGDDGDEDSDDEIPDEVARGWKDILEQK